MALLNSLFAGVSGMRNLQSMMDVIGNNIANVDTIGFKGSRVTFSDTFNQFIQSGTNPTATTGGTNSFQIGLGSKINSIDRNWNQGTFEQTGNTTDLALQGPGLFILKSNGQNFYTRAGSFIFDADGKLVNPQNGAVVQGKVAVDGVIPSGNTIQDIKIDKNLRIPAIKTTDTTWGGNLQSSATNTQTQNIVQSGTIIPMTPDPSATPPINYPASGSTPDPTVPGYTIKTTTIYDKNGNSYNLSICYTQTAADKFDISYKIASADNKTTIVDWTPLKDSKGNNVTGVTINDTTGPADNPPNTVTGPFDIPVPNPPVTGYDPGDITLDASAVKTGTDNTLSYIVDDNRTPTIVNGSVTVYDSLGNSHTLTLKFTKTDQNTWRWNASVPSTDGQLSNNSGSITFKSDGTIDTMSPNPPILSYAPTGGAESQTIKLDFGSGTSGITQNSATSQIAALSQNGSASASLSNINIDQYGNIEGIFSNGQSQALAQVMVATFPNNNGLVSVGDNMYTVAANSGDPRVSDPGETSATTIQSGALEQSNVDLAKEFTNMIVAQRGFEANAHVITTSDTLLQDITNLIR